MATTKKISVTELANKSLQQLVSLRNELRKELFNSRLALSIRKLNQTHTIKLARRNIARINTVITQKSV